MPTITVQLRNADPNLTDQLAVFVAARGLGPGRTPAAVDVETRAGCDTTGTALAEFVAARPGPYQMVVDGPEASTTIFQLHTVDDTNVIGAVAMCSGLL
jgi:hypothetical protein